jgi:phospholipid/cholesterol/gamma-HCH transport system ATP-binding protein
MTFGKHEVLKGISSTFLPGKVNMIIGASGSGKSVLMKALVGLHTITSGHIYYGDTDLANISDSDRLALRRQVGMLFQNSALFDSMTVEENVIFPLNMFSKESKSWKLDRVNFCLERVGLVNTNKKLPSEISGGMKKRVGIARAIVLNPAFLFVDEPNSGLDPLTSILIDELIKEITVEYQMTTLVNTHDMNSVMEIGDHIVYIYQGKKCWEGDKNAILTTDNEILNNFVFATNFLKDFKQRRN